MCDLGDFIANLDLDYSDMSEIYVPDYEFQDVDYIDIDEITLYAKYNFKTKTEINKLGYDLKVIHTYKVVENSKTIATMMNLSEEDIALAELIGLLHDIGRFEQVKRYGTFNDPKSVDHAKLGSSILFSEGKIKEFIVDNSEYDLIKSVIENHNEYRLPENISNRCKTFSNILRDADKIDIFYRRKRT